MSFQILSFFGMLAKDKPLWMELIGMLIPLGLAIWGFVRAYRAWERQKKREIDLHLDQKRYERKLDACLGLWPLLAYMSKYESEKSIFVERDDKEYFFRRAQAAEYLEKLPESFFEQGHGVFAPLEVREGLYHFRNIVYGLMLATAKEETDAKEIKINNKEIVEIAVPKIFKQINTHLRQMLLDSRIDFSE